MKWQQREYSPQQMQQMQQEAAFPAGPQAPVAPAILLCRTAVRPARSCAAGSFCRTTPNQQLSPTAANTAFILRRCKRRFPAGFSSP